MAGLLYYLPGEDPQRPNQVTIKRVRELGLGYALTRCTPSGVHRDGPDGKSGVVVADGQQVEKIGYYADRQRWRRIPGLSAYVGFYVDQRPGPEDLARKDPLAGHWVTLADGQAYLIPIARGWSDDQQDPGWYAALPRKPELDDQDQWIQGDVVSKYARLWQIATAWWDAKSEAAQREETESEEEPQESVQLEIDFNRFGGLLDAAVEVLGVNYHVGKAEVALLELLDSGVAIKILDAAVDWPTIESWLQKKTSAEETFAAGSSPTADGPPAETPATAPP